VPAGSLEALKHAESDVGTRAAAISRMIDAESRALHEKRSQVEQLRARVREVPDAIRAAESDEKAARASLDEHRGAVARWERSTQYQMTELERGEAFYQRLGLKFLRADDDRVRLIFSAIDPADPAREFSFAVHVSPDEVYTVSDCAPPVPNLAALVDTLNRTNDFSAFVQRMRAAFKASIHL
jgi:Chromosome segregation protein Spc25